MVLLASLGSLVLQVTQGGLEELAGVDSLEQL